MTNRSEIWDALIVGAGPAGAVAAALLAERGSRVLLVDKSDWPREKVCGGCLSPLALAQLSELGLPLDPLSTLRLHRTAWHVGDRTLKLPSGGAAIVRSDLDAQIVAMAQQRGCEFRPSSAATLLPFQPDDPHRTIALRGPTGNDIVQAYVVLAADGIGGTLLAHEPWATWEIDSKSWMGISSTYVFWPPGLQSGTVHMHIGYDGYVGLVRLHDDRVHLAAALKPDACRDAGGPAPLIKQILQSCNRPTPIGFTQNRFRGTSELTRARDPLAGHRVLAIGDACGYVEPFTGEGIAWSIAAARAAVEILPDDAKSWPANLPALWKKRHAKTVARRQRWCQRLRPIMHHPTLATLAVNVGRGVPLVGRFLASCAGQSPHAAADAQLPKAIPAAQGDAG